MYSQKLYTNDLDNELYKAEIVRDTQTQHYNINTQHKPTISSLMPQAIKREPRTNNKLTNPVQHIELRQL